MPQGGHQLPLASTCSELSQSPVSESAQASSTIVSVVALAPGARVMQALVVCRAVGVDGGADNAHFVGGWDEFEAAALERAHLDHFVEEPVEQADVYEFYFRSGYEECSWTFHVDAGGSSSGKGAVTQHHEFLAARVTGVSVFKNFFGFEIKEAQAHRTASENSLEMPAAAAAAEIFLGIEGDDGVAAFPDSFAGGEAAKADAIAKRPDADELVQFALRGGDSRGHDVGVIE